MPFRVALLAISGVFGCQPPTAPLRSSLEGTGSYPYDAGRTPVEVFFYVPPAASALSSIVIVMHGNQRNASEYRDAWIDLADEHDLIIAAPRFPETSFPGTNGYQLGNVFVDGEVPLADEQNDSAEWTYAIIDPLAEDFAERTANASTTFHLFGHSAGAQFVHRLVQFVPESRFGYAMAANAGWYTLPDSSVAFPYGLGVTPFADDEPTHFSRHLMVFAGSDDTDENSASLRQTPEAAAQGRHRFERAQYFYAESARLATASDSPFVWDLQVVDGVGHNHIAMGRAAGDWLAAELNR